MGKKLKLMDLKVQSFVTSLNSHEKNMVKGGDGPQISGEECDPTYVCETRVCPPTWNCTQNCNTDCCTLAGGCSIYCTGSIPQSVC